MLNVFLVIVIGYLLGNVQTSFILGRMFEKKDIRKYGSGNAGATNALRVFGVKIAGFTFLFDALKAVIAVLIGNAILPGAGGFIAGVSVVVGHNWPILLGFQGGKGVASTIGAVLALNYMVALTCVTIGVIIIISTKYVSLGSIAGMGLLPVIGLLFIRPFDLYFFIFTLILSVMAIVRHRSNIGRLLKGNENKIRHKA